MSLSKPSSSFFRRGLSLHRPNESAADERMFVKLHQILKRLQKTAKNPTMLHKTSQDFMNVQQP